MKKKNRMSNKEEYDNICKTLNINFDANEITIENLYEFLLDQVNNDGWLIDNSGMIRPGSDYIPIQLRFASFTNKRIDKNNTFTNFYEFEIAEDQYQKTHFQFGGNQYLQELHANPSRSEDNPEFFKNPVNYQGQIYSHYRNIVNEFKTKSSLMDLYFKNWKIIGIKKRISRFLNENDIDIKDAQYELVFESSNKGILPILFRGDDIIWFCNDNNGKRHLPIDEFSKEKLEQRQSNKNNNSDLLCDVNHSVTPKPAKFLTVKNIIGTLMPSKIRQGTWERKIIKDISGDSGGIDRFEWSTKKIENGIPVIRIVGQTDLYKFAAKNKLSGIKLDTARQSLRLVGIEQISGGVDLWKLKFVYLKSGIFYNDTFVLFGSDKLELLVCSSST